MSYFLRQGSDYKVISEKDIEVTDALPVGNYVVKQVMPQLEDLFLQSVPPFAASGKLYGNTRSRATRILSTANDRPNSTGVLLAGEKGSGKTLLAREICVLAAAMGWPTITVNTARAGDHFNQLIQSVNQPAVVLFDEFDKVYRDPKKQEEILTLMDGIFQTRKLFVLTCNNVHAINEHMLNRPGRLYYYLHFYGLEEEFIREFCQDTLNDVSKIDSICTLASLFVDFNFDMLKAVVEEMNRYGEDPHEVVKMLNAKPAAGNEGDFVVELHVTGKQVKPYHKKWRGNPLSSSDSIDIYYTVVTDSSGDEVLSLADPEDDYDDGSPSVVSNDGESPARFKINHLTKIDAAAGTYEFVDQHRKLVLTRERRPSEFDMKGVV